MNDSCYYAEVYRIQGTVTKSATILGVDERDKSNEIPFSHGNTSCHYQCEGCQLTLKFIDCSRRANLAVS